VDKITQSLLYTEEEYLLKSITQMLYIVDFGIITAVSTDKTKVDVQHAAIPVIYKVEEDTSTATTPTVTKNIEVLYLGSSKFGLTYDVAVGDVVLLIGSKDYLASVTGTVAPAVPKSFIHYKQETMKAIPIKSSTTVNISVHVDGSTLKIGAGTQAFVKGTLTQSDFDTKVINPYAGHTHTVSVGGTPYTTSTPTGAITNPIAVSAKIFGE
jgi:hypothetical protein